MLGKFYRFETRHAHKGISLQRYLGRIFEEICKIPIFRFSIRNLKVCGAEFVLQKYVKEGHQQLKKTKVIHTRKKQIPSNLIKNFSKIRDSDHHNYFFHVIIEINQNG
jgi:hypothetical protein